MSKVPEPNAWDARDAFHRATLTVYSDLGALVDVLKREPDLRVALLLLDEHASPGAAPERGDPEFVADLKHAAGWLRSSLETVQRLRKTPGGAASEFGSGGSFAGIATVSYHDALIDAAQEALEPNAEGAARSGRIARPQSESGVMRRQVIAAVMDAQAWPRLAEDLKREFARASLQQPSDPLPEHPEYDERLERLEEMRLELKRPLVAKATATADVAALFKLWESTTDILFLTNSGAVLSRPEELFHLRQIVFALAAAAHDRDRPRAAMNRLSELLNLLMPNEWFNNHDQRQRVSDAICLAGVEIREFYFHAMGSAPADAAQPLPAWPAPADDKEEATPPSSVVLKFPRPLEAKQKCLDALAAAPNGIPTHALIADTIGLDLQTVKEAMATLKKAGFVTKRLGAWFITQPGDEQLKRLRGE